MNAITMLEQDHVRIKRLLDRLEATTPRGVITRRALFARIRTDLTVHETIEEEIFYPALKAHPDARDAVLEGTEEHHVVDEILGEMVGLSPDHETWGAKATVARENILHHIGEEEAELLPMARRIFERRDLETLGKRMAVRRASARASAVGLATARER